MTPKKQLAGLKPESATERANFCRAFLSLHGFLTKNESAAVSVRIKKWSKSGRDTFEFGMNADPVSSK
jgi:hypothetical protein